jgi:hypothetical protein
MQDVSDLICQQPGCTLSSDGTCLEGLDDPHQCPHVTAVSAVGQENAEAEAGGASVDDTSDWQSIPGGYELTVEEANEITCHHDASVVAIAGEPDAGKTTLMATLFELLGTGSVPGYKLAGSETILAFERACFPSRIVSGNRKPDTVRTKHMRPRFYHLCIRAVDGSSERRHLLLADISGEAYQRASDNHAEARKLHFLRRANLFVLIIDGDKLRVKRERQDVVQRALLILRALLLAEVLLPTARIQVVVSKLDRLDRSDANSSAFLAYIRDEFRSQFSTTLRQLEIFEIAARPATADYDFGFGVIPLMLPWISEPEERWSDSEWLKPANRELRQSELFLWRFKWRTANA